MNPLPKLFLDFDGTIVDPRPRYYYVYSTLLGASSTPLPLDDYWKLKQAAQPERTIVAEHHHGVDANDFAARRLAMIESEAALAHEQPIPGAVEAVQALRRAHDLYLVTLRRNRAGLQAELARLGLDDCFVEVLSAPATADPAGVKVDLIGKRACAADWMIGDTEADIGAGQRLHMMTCGVATGIRTSDFLHNLKPTHVIGALRELPSLLRDAG